LENIRYAIDTSVLVQAKRTYYAFDIAPTFWNHVGKLSNDKLIISIDKVYDEIERGKDDLFDWVQDKLPKEFFGNTHDSSILSIYKRIMQWSSSNSQYNQNAKNEFAEYQVADPWLVAYAIQNNLAIVSQEVFDVNIKRKIPIPNACNEFNVRHIDTF
jgi:hypothetical protein